jgi:hypothetical protein
MVLNTSSPALSAADAVADTSSYTAKDHSSDNTSNESSSRPGRVHREFIISALSVIKVPAISIVIFSAVQA